MGRKRSAKKKRTPRSASLPKTAGAEMVAAIRSDLARGRTKQALQAANVWRKASPGPDADALYLEVAEARIAQLGDGALFAAAAQLAASVEERFPGRLAGADLVALRGELRRGEVARAIRELARDDLPAPRRKALAELFAAEVADPGRVASCDAVSPDHWIRREAAAARRALEAATAGTSDPATLARETRIPRHSPFAAWKLLALGIEAAYQGDGDALERIARAMPPHARPARLLPVLRALAGGLWPKDPTPAERALLSRIGGNVAGAVADLESLDAAIEQGRERLAGQLARGLTRWFEAEAPALLSEYHRVLHRDWYAADDSLDALGFHLADGGERVWDRRQALASESLGEVPFAIDAWERYLSYSASKRSSLEVSLVRTRQATLAARGRRLDAAWGDHGCDCPACRSRRESGGVDGLEGPARRRPSEYLREALDAHPTADGWRALVAALDAEDDRRAIEPALTAWRADFPQDPAPVLDLLRRAEARGAHRKALRLLDAAERLAPTHPEVREGRIRLLVKGALRRLRQGKAHLAAQDVDALRAILGSADAEGRLPLDILAWLTAWTAEDEPGLAAAWDALVGGLGAGGAALAVREATASAEIAPAAGSPVPPPPPRSLPAREAARALALLERALPRLGWALSGGGAWAREIRKAVKQGLEPPREDWEALCSWAHRRGDRDLLFALSGVGLRKGGVHRYRFLLPRARSLLDRRGQGERVRACLRAARALARQVNDTAFVALVGRERWQVPASDPRAAFAYALAELARAEESPVDPETAAAILRQEGDATPTRVAARPTSARPARTRRTRRTRRARHSPSHKAHPTLFDLGADEREEDR